MEKARLMLTRSELEAVKIALYSFVTRNTDPVADIACADDVVSIEKMKAEIAAMPVAADVLLKHFKGW